ncbi:hypothetical protein ACRAWF_04505 [Streptomyces sp. L7]
MSASLTSGVSGRGAVAVGHEHGHRQTAEPSSSWSTPPAPRRSTTPSRPAFDGQLVEAAAAHGPAGLIDLASITSRALFPGYAAYIIRLGRNPGAELGPSQVRVATLEPRIVDTEMQSHAPGEEPRQPLAEIAVPPA